MGTERKDKKIRDKEGEIPGRETYREIENEINRERQREWVCMFLHPEKYDLCV